LVHADHSPTTTTTNHHHYYHHYHHHHHGAFASVQADHSPTMSWSQTSLPVYLHCFGLGVSVIIKVRSNSGGRRSTPPS